VSEEDTPIVALGRLQQEEVKMDNAIIVIHALCYPIYQILGTIRHELAHVIAARLSGVGILEWKVIPHFYNDQFYWGRVQYDPATLHRTNIHISLAPYYVCALYAIAFVVLRMTGVLDQIENQHLKAFIGIAMVVSPAFDFFYNLYKYARYNRGDFAYARKLIKGEKP
jgi:hypothetical protein